jgi:Ca-activated chloride channel homolog
MLLSQRHLGRKASLLRFFGGIVIVVSLSATLLAQPSPRVIERSPLAPETGEEARLRVNTEVVSLTVSVSDQEGRFLPGLTKQDFKVMDDRVIQEISYFSDGDAPASVGIVFDLSSSMSVGKINRAREALARFIQTSHQEDEYFLIGFRDHAEVLLAGTRDSEALLQRVGSLRPEGETALYDGVALALKQVFQGRYAKRALIVISDGEDNHSRTTYNQVRRQLQEANVTIWTVLIGPLLPRSNGGAVLDKLAAVSGGKSFFPRNAEKMSEDFEQIALELRRQYSIGYSPSNLAADGKWHRIKVEVAPSATATRAVVRTRTGYYAGRSATRTDFVTASMLTKETPVTVVDCCAEQDQMTDCGVEEFSSKSVCK